jgi:hypothetical protein
MIERIERPLQEELTYRWPPGPVTDPVWMEYLLHKFDLEGEVRNRVLAVQFETLANVHMARAEGYRNVAKLLGG